MAVKTTKNPQPQGKVAAVDTDEERMDAESAEAENPPANDGAETKNSATSRSRDETRAGKGNAKGHVDRDTLLVGLNHDLSGEYQAILMYTHYAAKLTGPYRKELRALFQAEVADEQGHAQFLADKIAVLGGEPTTQPRPVASADDPHAMLENALAAEKQAIADYRVRIEQAEAFGDIGLKVDLENQIADETRHKEELERILTGWGNT